MKKSKNSIIKEKIRLLILSSLVLFGMLTCLLGVDFYYRSLEYTGKNNQQLYGVSGTCSNVYSELEIISARKRVSKEIFVIDGKKYEISSSRIIFSTEKEYEKFKNSCITHGVTIQYRENFFGVRRIASLTTLENDKVVVDLNDTIKLTIQRQDFIQVADIILCSLFICFWCIYNWNGIKVICNIIKKKRAKAKRKAEREKIFSKQDPQ